VARSLALLDGTEAMRHRELMRIPKPGPAALGVEPGATLAEGR
jgi:hypothetical protein